MFGGLTGRYEGFFKKKILSKFLSQNSQSFYDKIQEENQHKTTDNETVSFFSVHIRKSYGLFLGFTDSQFAPTFHLKNNSNLRYSAVQQNRHVQGIQNKRSHKKRNAPESG